MDENNGAHILALLEQAGHQSYWVGGCVRDRLLGRQPKDWDIATSASPAQILTLFQEEAKPINAAQAWPVVVVEGIQVATFRADKRGARRRDLSGVTTGATLEQDAGRRDLTVNALYEDLSGNVLDPTGQGLQDIGDRLIRLVGLPTERLKEDPIRVLRAIKFAARLGFTMEPATFVACSRPRKLLAERAGGELGEMLSGPGASTALAYLESTGWLKRLLPEVARLRQCQHDSPHHLEGDVLAHTGLVLERLPTDCPALAWAGLLHDIGKPSTKQGGTFRGHEDVGAAMVAGIAKRLRWSNQMRDDVTWLVEHHMTAHRFHEMRRGKLARFAAHPLIHDLLELQRADSLGRIPSRDDARPREAVLAYQAAVPAGRSLRDVGIDGNVLMERFKLAPGPEVGFLRTALEDLWAEHPDASGEELLEMLEAA